MTVYTRGIPNDRVADFALGQRNFYESGDYSPISLARLKNPIGCTVDRGAVPEIVYVMDSAYNRILGLEWDGTTLNVTTPAVVLGQPDSSSCAANGDSCFNNFPTFPVPTAQTLQLTPIQSQSPGESSAGARMDFDSARNLWTLDPMNHRALRYPLVAGVRQSTADVVLGQADFVSCQRNRGGANPANNTLSLGWGYANTFAGGVCVDPTNDDVWISDIVNARVLRFPAGTTTADLVIGQAGFTTATRGSGLNELSAPAGLTFNADGSKLYVCDTPNARVMVYARASFATGMSGAAFATGIGWNRPMTADFDPNHDAGDLWITDTNSIHTGTATGATTGPPGTMTDSGAAWATNQHVGAVVFAGSQSMTIASNTATGLTGTGAWSGGGNPGAVAYSIQGNATIHLVRESDGASLRAKTLQGANEGVGGGIGIDTAGNIFATQQRAEEAGHLVLWKKADEAAPRTYSTYFAGDGGAAGITANGLKVPRSVVAINDQVIVHDYGRVLFWNNRATSLSDGKAADGFLTNWAELNIAAGDATAFSQWDSNGIDGFWLNAESQGRYLWMTCNATATHSAGVARWNLPVVKGQVPDSSFCRDSTALPLLGGGLVTMTASWGCAPSANSSELWITQVSDNRAFRLRNPLAATSSADNAAISYGANTVTDTRNPWTVNALVGATVLYGTSPNRWMMEVASNTVDTITGTTGWRTEAGSWSIVLGGSHPTNGVGYHILPTVDVILGQADSTTTTANRGGAAAKNTLNLPGSCQLDAAGNLWVSDDSLENQGNYRLLCFLKATIPSNNVSIQYGPNCDYIYPSVSVFQPAFAPSGELVIGYNAYGPAPDSADPIMTAIPQEGTASFQGRFCGIYNSPLDPTKFDGSGNRTGGPDGYLKDYTIMPIGASFHADGSLYISDLNQSRILVYTALNVTPVVTPPARRVKRDRGVVGKRTWF